MKTEDQSVAAGQEVFEVLMGRIAERSTRVEPRRRARAFVLGLLSDLSRKSCWTLSAHTGDADAVRDDVRSFVVEHLHHEDAVLAVDETGGKPPRSEDHDLQLEY